MQCPGFFVDVGTVWNLFFLNLRNWLEELHNLDLADQDSVMIQYKADDAWKPLAGDEQLKGLLNEYNNSGYDLYVRCAPESEFKSGSDDSNREDEGAAIINGFKKAGHVGSLSADKADKKAVSRITTTLSYFGFDC